MKARDLFELHGGAAPAPAAPTTKPGAPVREPGKETPPPRREPKFPNPFRPTRPGEKTTPKACMGRRMGEGSERGVWSPQRGLNSPLAPAHPSAEGAPCSCGEIVFPHHSSFGMEYQCPTCGERWEEQEGARTPTVKSPDKPNSAPNPRALGMVDDMLETKLYARPDPDIGGVRAPTGRVASAARHNAQWKKCCGKCGKPHSGTTNYCPTCQPARTGASQSTSSAAPPNTLS